MVVSTSEALVYSTALGGNSSDASFAKLRYVKAQRPMAMAFPIFGFARIAPHEVLVYTPSTVALHFVGHAFELLSADESAALLRDALRGDRVADVTKPLLLKSALLAIDTYVATLAGGGCPAGSALAADGQCNEVRRPLLG